MKPLPPQGLGQGKAEQGQSRHGELTPEWQLPAVQVGGLEQPDGEAGQHEGDQQTYAYLLQHQGDGQRGGARMLFGGGDEGEQQEQHGHTDAVVEAALLIEPFAHRRRHHRVAHHGFAQRRIGGGENGGEDGHLQ